MSLYQTHVWFTLKMVKSSGLTLLTLDSYVIASAHPFKSHKPCTPGAAQSASKVDQNPAGGRGDATNNERESLTFAVVEEKERQHGGRGTRRVLTHCGTGKSGIPGKDSYPRQNKHLHPQTHSTRWHPYDKPILQLLVFRRVD